MTPDFTKDPRKAFGTSLRIEGRQNSISTGCVGLLSGLSEEGHEHRAGVQRGWQLIAVDKKTIYGLSLDDVVTRISASRSASRNEVITGSPISAACCPCLENGLCSHLAQSEEDEFLQRDQTGAIKL